MLDVHNKRLKLAESLSLFVKYCGIMEPKKSGNVICGIVKQIVYPTMSCRSPPSGQVLESRTSKVPSVRYIIFPSSTQHLQIWKAEKHIVALCCEPQAAQWKNYPTLFVITFCFLFTCSKVLANSLPPGIWCLIMHFFFSCIDFMIWCQYWVSVYWTSMTEVWHGTCWYHTWSKALVQLSLQGP